MARITDLLADAISLRHSLYYGMPEEAWDANEEPLPMAGLVWMANRLGAVLDDLQTECHDLAGP